MTGARGGTVEEWRRTAEVLEQRARALSRPTTQEFRTGRDHMVTVIGAQRVAVPVTAVREVLAPAPVTRLPRTPPELPGVRAVRGEVLCLADTAAVLGLSHDRAQEEQHVVVLLGEAPLGLLVDEIAELTTIDEAEMGRPPATGSSFANLLTAVTRSGTLLLDPSAVLADPRLDLSTTTPTSHEGRA